MHHTYKIASLIVQMETHGIAHTFSMPYRVSSTKEVDIVIHSFADKIKELHPEYSDEMCEYLGSGTSFYYQLLSFNGMMLHSSAIVLDNRAYLFSAKSGTGKSTHTSLWRQVFGDDCVRILNDDKPALRFEDGTWYAYGTPWSGKTGQNLNLRVPVAGICFLERGKDNKIERIGSVNALQQIINQTSRPKDPALLGKLLGVASHLVEDVPIWRMECNMNPDAAMVSYIAMSGENIK